MSRTNHHRRYKRWNITRDRVTLRWNGALEIDSAREGMEVYDLRFYAGCRRTPQAVHRVLDFHGRYPWRILYGAYGVAKSYADIREGQFRAATRTYVQLVSFTWNAGGDVEEIGEPDRRPRTIDYDLW